MAIKAGTRADFADSMAEAMEEAFANAWDEFKDVPLPEAGREERQMLFVAIAQGVVRHLLETAGEAFQIGVETTQVHGTGVGPLIVSENATVTVTQDSGATNMVKSSGTATVDQVLTEALYP